jgi:hypothetical protein
MNTLFKALLFAPVAASLVLASVAQAADQSDTLKQIRKYANPGKPTAQVTSINQFTDVDPTSWAFQALQSLVERYGCIVGYPDKTYRGNRPLSRYEFAAGLNACLDKVLEAVASKEDLDALKRLMDEFGAELAALRGRVDALEARVVQIEATQFSTTTKLRGEVIINVGGINSGEDPSPYGGYRTTVAPKDRLTQGIFNNLGPVETSFSDYIQAQATATALANSGDGPFATTSVPGGSGAVNGLIPNPADRQAARAVALDAANTAGLEAAYQFQAYATERAVNAAGEFIDAGNTLNGLMAPRSLAGVTAQFFNTADTDPSTTFPFSGLPVQTNPPTVPGQVPTFDQLTAAEQAKALRLVNTYTFNPFLASDPKLQARAEANAIAAGAPLTDDQIEVLTLLDSNQTARSDAAAGLTGYTGNGGFQNFYLSSADFASAGYDKIGSYASYVQSQVAEQTFASSLDGINVDQNNVGVLAFSRFVDANLGNLDGTLDLGEAQKFVRVLSEDVVPRKAATTMDNRVRLALATSFNGKDLLFTRLQASNILPYGRRVGGSLDGSINGFPGANLDYDGTTFNTFQLNRLYYKFPTGSINWIVGTQFEVEDALATTGTFYGGQLMNFFADAGQSIIFSDDSGTGAGANWKFSDNFNFSLAYINYEGGFTSQVASGRDQGLFGDDYQLTGQIAYRSNNGKLLGALTYALRDAVGFGSDNGTQRALLPFGPGMSTQTSNLGLNLAYAVSKRFNINGSFGYSWASANTRSSVLGVPMVGNGTGDTANLINWSVALGFPNAWQQGDDAGIAIGQVPYVTSNDSGWGTDDSPLAVEAWYRFQVTDNISVMPGVYYISNVNKTISGDNDSVWGYVLKTTFRF